ncbi:hypothetical protein [Massilicoli timonensis]|uniref:hypothetical protein n=1 Tax=Massilicoli timonensis TaxID=2015901 RepID=UPI000C85F660|nr:hypothetical protein [Massilicoli timonensis]
MEKEGKVFEQVNVNNWWYISILIICIASMIYGIQNGNKILENLGYGGIASTVVAWWLDFVSVKQKNKELKIARCFLYNELVSLITFDFIGIAQFCKIYFLESIDLSSDSHTFKEWLNILDSEFHKLENKNSYLSDFQSRTKSKAEIVLKYLNKIEDDRFYLYREQMLNADLWSKLRDIQFTYYVLATRNIDDNYIEYVITAYKDLCRYLEEIGFLKWITKKRFQATYNECLKVGEDFSRCF